MKKYLENIGEIAEDIKTMNPLFKKGLTELHQCLCFWQQLKQR